MTYRFEPTRSIAIVLAVVLLPMIPAAVQAAGAPTVDNAPPPIPLAEVRSGMTGYGLSVFSGSRIDTFGVRVIGVQRGSRVDGGLILIEISGQELEQSRVVQGMSGSPVFIEGRFAGALAFGWAGSLEPIAGVTPAAEMLRLPSSEPVESRAAALRFEPLDLATSAPELSALAARIGDSIETAPEIPVGMRGPIGWPAPEALVTELLPELAADESPGSGWICRPLGSGTVGGGAVDRITPGLFAGSSCAVPLILGDAQLGAIGTVTWVQGDRVLMMGHPFLQRGPVNLPLAQAEIVTVLPARDMSFKMGSIGAVVGAVHHDNRAGLAGRLGAAAPLVPVEVEISRAGADPRTYRFEVADDPMLAPSLVFWTLYNSLLVEGNDASLQTVDYRIETDWTGDPELERSPLLLEGVAAGPAGVQGLAGQWMAPLTMLMGNPWKPIELKAVRARLNVRQGLQSATIRSLTGPVHGLRPGDSLHCRVQLQPRYGSPLFENFELRLPADLHPGPLRLVAASAADLFALEAQRAAGIFQVHDLSGTVDLLRAPRSADELAVVLFEPGRSLILEGKEWKALPGSMRRFLSESNSGETHSLADAVVRSARPVEWLLQGYSVLELNLLPETPARNEERRP